MPMRRRTITALGAGAAVIAVAAWLSGGDRSVAARMYCDPVGRLTPTAQVLSHRSYCVRPYSQIEKLRPRVPSDFDFDIVDDRGEALREFATVHEKIMHVILVRHDLTQFQHLHPTFSGRDGRFTIVNLVVPVEGPYRLFADFTPAGGQQGPDGGLLPITRSVDLAVGDQERYEPEPPAVATDSAAVGAYEVGLARPDTLRAGEKMRLNFSVRRDGRRVEDLEPYLGANGHAVILREGDLAFIHSHALEDDRAMRAGELPFMVQFTEPGRYRMFVQFQHRGVVQTVPIALPPIVGGVSMSVDDGHSTH